MSKRTDIHSILVIGSGPIIIGQACEFDYSGVQACKALREEGYKVILINSNPATIMTDPEFSHRTYIEPITPEIVERIIVEEKPDALLPTLGGQTALNTAMALFKSGVLEKHGVRMIGANAEAITKGEDRQIFKDCMLRIGLDVPKSGTAHSLDESRKIATDIGSFPLIIRPAFTLGGTGGGIAYNKDEFEEVCQRGLDLSPTTEILIEECLLGWKEYEMEVMRDKNDNCVVICSIENFDPMGVHTGDSITVAPIQTLTDKEYQRMRDASFAVIREIGVETGGSNIQFSVDPRTGRMIVIEMNPRVSRSSALASKATGFPIAKIAAKLAVGYTLDELKNDITRETPASFEPVIDYVVTKIPRFTFEKFPGADATLTSQMKSVGEAMAIGRTFKESFQKAVRSLDLKGRDGTLALGTPAERQPDELIQTKLRVANHQRLWWLTHAFQCGYTVEQIFELSAIDPWFLEHIRSLQELALKLERVDLLAEENLPLLVTAKEHGFSDAQLAALSVSGSVKHYSEKEIRAHRQRRSLTAAYRLVDTCAAEFEAYTPYFYSTYDRGDNEIKVSPRKKVMILGGGPNRIGQGIEFDYCCVHASLALREAGFESIMVNSNPETVSTDYDISDKLYFEPLTVEDVLNIYDAENVNNDVLGVIVQFGGQTPLNLAEKLAAAGVRVIGTSVEAIARAEDRKLFQQMLHKLALRQPENATATSADEALSAARALGYPILMRPSFVLGGRNMKIIYNDDELKNYLTVSGVEISRELPVLLDRFLNNATEVDVDCIADGETFVIGAVMEHIEAAGVHSGDSACVIPPHSLPLTVINEIKSATIAMARELGVRGLMNVQFAVQDGTVYVLEVNPRASRTVPFVSKAIGAPLAKYASLVMAGRTLRELGFTQEITPKFYNVKEAVFPFNKFRGVDILLGPEMKSTGEVMGISDDLGTAYAKTQMAAGSPLPVSGKVFISVRDEDKPEAVELAKQLRDLGFTIVSTSGTAKAIANAEVKVELLFKVAEGRPNILDLLKNSEITLVINTPKTAATARADETVIRTTAHYNKVPVMTTIAAAKASVQGIRSLKKGPLTVKALQEYHG
ncbi:MAG: carbamoyl-phosphate synthase large subunit [Verrucomicrobiales bacterium]|jgi:carbamoyl-phosphate synthase large subunit|nr:carbamoyl-phosphate synthase large subunit [Verrucomicrobiales bacterium]